MHASLPTLILERCAQTIEGVIIPRLTNQDTAMQAGLVAMLLHLLAPKVEYKGKELLKENAGMKEVLERVVELLRKEALVSTGAERDRLIETVGLEMDKLRTADFDLSEENHILKGALVKTISGLEAPRDELSAEVMASLRQQIRLLLRQQLNFELDRARRSK